MRITFLGSGSQGNAALVQAGATRLLVDAGVSPSMLQARHELAHRAELDRLDAIVLSHGHGDHAQHALACARAFDAPIYLTQATRRSLRSSDDVSVRVFGKQTPFDIGAITLSPHPAPHDAPQVAVVLEADRCRAAIVTDLGHVPAALLRHLAGCEAVCLEANHDPSMLHRGPYPALLKARIDSPRGHLSNDQCAAALAALSPRCAVLLHLSTTNNTPDLARSSVTPRLSPRTEQLLLADQTEPLVVDVPPGLRNRPGLQLSFDL